MEEETAKTKTRPRHSKSSSARRKRHTKTRGTSESKGDTARRKRRSKNEKDVDTIHADVEELDRAGRKGRSSSKVVDSGKSLQRESESSKKRPSHHHRKERKGSKVKDTERSKEGSEKKTDRRRSHGSGKATSRDAKRAREKSEKALSGLALEEAKSSDVQATKQKSVRARPRQDIENTKLRDVQMTREKSKRARHRQALEETTPPAIQMTREKSEKTRRGQASEEPKPRDVQMAKQKSEKAGPGQALVETTNRDVQQMARQKSKRTRHRQALEHTKPRDIQMTREKTERAPPKQALKESCDVQMSKESKFSSASFLDVEMAVEQASLAQCHDGEGLQDEPDALSLASLESQKRKNKKIRSMIFLLFTLAVIGGVFGTLRLWEKWWPQQSTTSTDNQKLELKSIKYAPLLTGNVTIGPKRNQTTTRPYFLNINSVNFSIFDEEDLVLYLTLSPDPIFEEEIENDGNIRISEIALKALPMQLPGDFFPGDFNGILLSDENVDGRKLELLSSNFVVINKDENLVRPSDSPTMSLVPTAMKSESPTWSPSAVPSRIPTGFPSSFPSSLPSYAPTTTEPSTKPTSHPTQSTRPSTLASETPTGAPSANPSAGTRNTRLQEILYPLFDKQKITNRDTDHYKAFQWLDIGDGESISLRTDVHVVIQTFVMVLFWLTTTREGGWIHHYNFLNVTSGVCDWNARDKGNSGVFCNENGEIDSIILESNNLRGTLLTELGQLTALRVLQLGYNQISGSIPSSLGSLPNLAVLELSSNLLEGNLPILESNEDSIQILDLSDNEDIGGDLTIFFTQVPSSLNEIYCRGCILTGSIPLAAIQRLRSNLRSIDFERTGLFGTLPANFASLTMLSELRLAENRFSGGIPEEFGDLQNLEILDISSNDLSGTLSFRLGSLSKLSSLKLGLNQIRGRIPQELTALSQLEELNLHSNKLSGVLPILSGDSLRKINLNENDGLSGILETVFSTTSKSLVEFSCTKCSLRGVIPNSISEYSRMQILDLEATGIMGSIIPGLAMLKELIYLGFGGNSLSGSIPQPVISSTQIQVIRLNSNKLTGSITLPDTESLRVLDLSDNLNVTGNTLELFRSFPPSLTQFSCNKCSLSGALTGAWPARLSNLEYLELKSAGVSGSIPLEVGGLKALRTLHLGSNQLHGKIPTFTGKALQILNLDENIGIEVDLDMFFSSVSTSLTEFYCERCWINGTIPGRLLESYTNLEVFKLEDAGMTGTLPKQLGSLTKLVNLQLGENYFRGSIPQSIGDLEKVEVLELYKNYLTGDLPSFADNKNALRILDLSDNNGLSGDLEDFLESLPSTLQELLCEKCILDGEFHDCDIAHFQNLESLRLDEGGAIRGRLPSDIQMLKKLTYLDLSHNQLTGKIPREVGLLTALLSLDIRRNNLDGSIPNSLGDLSILASILLNENRITGTIPQKVASLPSLGRLDMSGNLLIGSFPRFIGQSLNYIDLDDNEGLSGNLTQFFDNLTGDLRFFSCDKCDLSGTIPSSGLSSQPNLEHLKLEDCNLYGRIPSTIGTLRKLTSLELGENKLKGIIPQEMQALSELQTLELYDNILTGALPNLLNLSSLSVLDVSSNEGLSIDAFNVFSSLPISLTEVYFDDIPLEGTLPYTAISNFKRLEYFGVEDCDLYGRMPLFTGLTNLKEIRMGGNSISGSIPRSIGELANLEVLELWENDLYGTIPSFSGNQNALLSLDLNENFGIVGSLGDLFRNLPTSVSKFWCEECSLTGELPGIRLAKFKNLTSLSIQENELTGKIPSELGSLVNLSRISLGGNSLSGHIPQQVVTNLPMLEIFDLWENKLTGTVPLFINNDGYLKRFDIEGNKLEGKLQALVNSLPPESLEKFYAGYNKLTGRIPSTLALFPKLRVFDIRWNKKENPNNTDEVTLQPLKIGGTVPLILQYMKSIEKLHLEGNNLRGQFPIRIAKIKSLDELAIHSNLFTGSLQEVCIVAADDKDDHVPDELTADCRAPERVKCSCCSECWSRNTKNWWVPPIV